jgi:hypothetical protein
MERTRYPSYFKDIIDLFAYDIYENSNNTLLFRDLFDEDSDEDSDENIFPKLIQDDLSTSAIVMENVKYITLD